MREPKGAPERRMRAATLALCVALGAVGWVGVPSAAGAEGPRVESTDDALAPGTCPQTNSFGLPTGGNCFIPDILTVEVGTTVVWASVGKRPHDVVADDGSFQSQYLYPGDTWDWTFSTVGEYPYYCSLHGDRGGVGHAGKITVVARGAAPPTAVPPGGGAAVPGGGSGATGGSVPGVQAPAAPVLVDTRIKVAIRREPAADDHAPVGGSSGILGSFGAGLLISLVLVGAWRWATAAEE